MSDEIKEQLQFFNEHLLNGNLHLSAYKMIIDNYEKMLHLKFDYRRLENEIQEEINKLTIK